MKFNLLIFFITLPFALKKQLTLLRKDLEAWMIKTKDPLLKVYQVRNQPDKALKEFYRIYPEAIELDKNKASYSKAVRGASD